MKNYQALKNMTMTANQKRMYELGKKAREYADTIRELCYIWDLEKIEEIANDKDERFFMAGFEGFVPRYVKAVRYGEIPTSGRSTNWATGQLEKGVSCVKIVKDDSDINDSSVYSVIYGLQGMKKILIEGWYCGDRGADGEPLLVHCKKIKELKNNIVK